MTCPAVKPDRTNVHRCLLGDGHDPPHECVCGHRWDDERRAR